jgi:hypothetical protein
MRKAVLFAAAILAVAAYVAWPFGGLYQLGHALHSRDAEAALERIDVTAVRRSIALQIAQEGTRVAGAERRLGEIGGQIAAKVGLAVLDRQLAEVITPQTLRQLIAEGEIPPELAEQMPAEQGQDRVGAAAGLPENPLRFIQDWEFMSPITFRVVIGEDRQPDHWTGLTLRLSGLTRQLAGVELPEVVMARIRPVMQERIREARS